MRTRFAFPWLAAAVAFGLGGCATYDVRVDAIAHPSLPQLQLTSYRFAGRAHGPGDVVVLREAARRLRPALAAHGLWEAPEGSSAELVIAIACAVDAPELDYEETVVAILPRNHQGRATDADLDKEITYEPAVVPVARREKHLTVSCRENRAGAEGHSPPLELWRIDVAIADEGADLNTYLPVLAAAVMTQLGRTTEGIEIVPLRKSDAAIQRIADGN